MEVYPAKTLTNSSQFAESLTHVTDSAVSSERISEYNLPNLVISEQGSVQPGGVYRGYRVASTNQQLPTSVKAVDGTRGGFVFFVGWTSS